MSILDDLNSIIENIVNESQIIVNEKKTQDDKWIQKAHVKKSKLHELLGIDAEKDIASKYSSGETLGSAVAKKLGGVSSIEALTKAIKMLTFASNMPKASSIFKVARNALIVKKELLQDKLKAKK